MPTRHHTVAELPQFLRDAEAIGISEKERDAIISAVATDPLRGDIVQGSGGVRKIRFAGRGRGKSGGFRVMAAYVGEDTPVYLLAVLSKSDRENFTASEVAAMKTAIDGIKSTWEKRKR